MTERGQALLEMYPLHLRRSHLIRAVCNAEGDEFDLLDNAIDSLQRNAIPYTADEFMAIFESELGLSIANPGVTDDQRKDAILAAMARATISGSQADWYSIASQIITSGWSYQVTGPKHSTLAVFTPYDNGSVQSDLIAALLRTITPATMLISVSPGPGFPLDRALLDRDLL